MSELLLEIRWIRDLSNSGARREQYGRLLAYVILGIGS